MHLPLLLASLSAIIYLVGFVPYIYHAFHGKVVPHPFSWTIWAILSTVNTFAIISKTGLTFELISPIVSTTSLFLWAIVWWFKFYEIRITAFDYSCLLLAVFIILIAYFFGVSHAIIPSIIVDMIVLSPSIKKIWVTPESEDVSGWIGAGTSRLLFLLSLGWWMFSFSSFWFWYSVIINYIVAVLIIRRTLYMKNWYHRLKFSIKNLL